MKRLVTLLFLFLVLSAVNDMQAQRRGKNRSSGFDYQLRGGLNFCQIDGDASGSYNKVGFHAGVGTSMPLSDNDRLRLCVEIGLTQKGSRIANSYIDRNISLLYVEVPIMAAYDFLDSRKLRVAAGVAPAILAKAKVTTDKSFDRLQSENYKRFDALPVVASIRYCLTDNFGVDLRYYNSILNIAKENGSGVYRIFRDNKGQFNRLIQAGITLSF